MICLRDTSTRGRNTGPVERGDERIHFGPKFNCFNVKIADIDYGSYGILDGQN